MTGRSPEHRAVRFATLLQALAIVGLAAMAAIILHKGFVDVSTVAGEHEGVEFWWALLRRFLRNLGAG